jgi:hypothetical protein
METDEIHANPMNNKAKQASRRQCGPSRNQRSERREVQVGSTDRAGSTVSTRQNQRCGCGSKPRLPEAAKSPLGVEAGRGLPPV